VAKMGTVMGVVNAKAVAGAVAGATAEDIIYQSPTEVLYPPGPLKRIKSFDDLTSLYSSRPGSSSDLCRLGTPIATT